MLTKGTRIAPTFQVEFSTSIEVRSFLDKFHYLGAASGCVNVIARHHSQIIGVWVFMKREAGEVYGTELVGIITTELGILMRKL